MTSRTLLHVGTMKTGTTYLQQRLYANRARLLDHGILVPGRFWRDQVAGVRDVMARARGDASPAPGAWQALVDEVRAHDGTSVISMEFLANARTPVAEFVCGSVPEPRVLVTARDLNRNLPAMWQTSLRNGYAWTWQEYLEGAEDHQPGRRQHLERLGDSSPARGPAHFWARQNLVRVVSTWSGLVPTTVLTVPPPRAPGDLLWQRLCRVLDLPDQDWAPAARGNESLGLATCLMLLQLNRQLDAMGSSWARGEEVRRHFLTSTVMPRRRDLEPRLGLAVSDWVQQRSVTMMGRLRELDVALVGDWSELTPHEVPGVTPQDVDPELVVDAAVTALAAVIDREASRTRTPGDGS